MRTVLILVAFPNRASAERIVKKVIDERLVACANIVAVASIYRWKGNTVRGREALVILKTTPRLVRRAVRAIERLHPYDVPCLEVLAASTNTPCGKWLRDVTGRREKHPVRCEKRSVRPRGSDRRSSRADAARVT